jgi:hypothetical protein
MSTDTAIDVLKELQPGWDSYDGASVELSVREDAKSFLAKVARALGDAYWAPKVGPTADGGVAFLWRKPGVPRKIEVRISPTAGNSFIIFQRVTVLKKGSLSAFDVSLLSQSSTA